MAENTAAERSADDHDALRHQIEVLRTLAVDLAQAADTSTVLWTIARSVMSVLDYEDCVIYLVDPSQDGVLVQRAAHGPKSPDGDAVVNPIALHFGEGIVGTSAELVRAVRVCDTSTDSRYVIDDAVRGSELAVPIDIAAIASARLRAAVTIEALERNVDELERTKAKLDRVARTDSLTGLLNRRGFEIAVEERLGRTPMASLALLDIDRFKSINDSHGHQCGDEVLREFADLLATETAGQDLFVARLGGDEFAVLGSNSQSLQRDETSSWFTTPTIR